MSSSYSLLPRSASTSPRRLSLHSILPPVVTSSSRARPLALLLLGIISLFVLFSIPPISDSVAPSVYALVIGGWGARRFRSEGLSRKLYKELRRIDHRSLVVRPVEREFVQDRSRLEEVAWTEEGLIPGRTSSWFSSLLPARRETDEYEGVGLIRGTTREPLPVHSIDTFPREVVLKRGHAGVGQDLSSLDRLMFGSVTTVKRAKQMTNLWTNWMIPKHADQAPPACLILLSDDETVEDMQELRRILEDRRLPCVLKQSHHERYEVRVMSMIQEMQEYSDSLE